MSEMQTIARPYARAAFAVARDAQQLAPWSDALNRLAEAAQDERMVALIGNPNIVSTTLVDLLAEAAGIKDQVAAVNLLKVLAENKRLSALPAVAEQFSALRDAYEQLCQVGVRSAAELSAAQQESFTAALKRRLGSDVSVEWVVEPELIGGAVVSAGDLVIDGSVQGELVRLRAGLSQ